MNREIFASQSKKALKWDAKSNVRPLVRLFVGSLGIQRVFELVEVRSLGTIEPVPDLYRHYGKDNSAGLLDLE